MAKDSFGVVGLGRIGGGLAAQALTKDYRVVGFDVAGPHEWLADMGLETAKSLEDLVARLESPRVIFLYVHAGPPIDEQLEKLAPLLDPSDVVVDGGNSYWGDSKRREKRWRESFRLCDVGTSGGEGGARHGACFMAGGQPEAVDRVEPILKDLSVEGGYVRAGGPGTGHYVKLVHNGIEFGMLQAIGEGVDLLERFDDDLPVADVLHCWRHGSVIRSWLVDLMEAAYKERGDMSEVPGTIEDTGEVNWLVEDAMRMEVPTPVIAQSVMQLFASRDDERNWAKAIALMRLGFGGHKLGRHPSLEHDRKIGRVGDVYRPINEDSD